MSPVVKGGACPSAEDPLVVIAIVSTDEAHNLAGCLQCLTASVHRNFHVMICENGGAGGYQRTVTALGQLEFIDERTAAPAGELPRRRLPSHEFVLSPGQQRVTVLNPSGNKGYAGGVNTCITAAADLPWKAVWVL